jgi:hypothetical protein
MKDSHPEISLYDVGDSVRENVSDYRYPGKITGKSWEGDHWEYVVSTNVLKDMKLSRDFITSSPETNEKMGSRVAAIRGESAKPTTEKKLSLKEAYLNEDFKEDAERRLVDALATAMDALHDASDEAKMARYSLFAQELEQIRNRLWAMQDDVLEGVETSGKV